jgi:aspartyl-tRNA synthetase
MISILHPSRSRPEKSYETIKEWVAKATTDIEVIISLDENDPKRKEYRRPVTKGMFLINPNRSAVDAINNAAKAATGDILIVVSDDTECPDRWDEKLLREVEGRTDWIMKTKDGIQPWIITMPVMDRTYYNRFGYVYHPDYMHMFCDTELTAVADLTGRKIESSLIFPHRHYTVTLDKPDEINEKANRTWAQGRALFVKRYENNFDLPRNGRRSVEADKVVTWLKKQK